MFNFPSDKNINENINQSIPNSLLPLFLSHYRQNYNNNCMNNSIEKLLIDTNCVINTLKKFCEFLYQNGFTIIKKSDERYEKYSQNSSSSFISGDNRCAGSEAKRTKEIRNCPHVDRKHYAKVKLF